MAAWLTSSALAYIDPGAGTLLIQFLIASVIGGTLFFRASIARVYGWIGNIFPKHRK